MLANPTKLASGCCGTLETAIYNKETGVCGDCRQRTEFVDENELFEDVDEVNSLIAKSTVYLTILLSAASFLGYLAGSLSAGVGQ
jgi:hypothetical protein